MIYLGAYFILKPERVKKYLETLTVMPMLCLVHFSSEKHVKLANTFLVWEIKSFKKLYTSISSDEIVKFRK